MNKYKHLFIFLLLSFPALIAQAQEKAGGITNSEEQTDFMRGSGKIYVVVAVIVIILAGLFLYLYNLDKKDNGNRKPEAVAIHMFAMFLISKFFY